MAEPIVTISGLRGLVGSTFEQPALRYIDSFLELLAESSIATPETSSAGTLKTIVLGYDGRPSGLEFRTVIEQLILSRGFNVWFLGVSPTPLVGFATRSAAAAGGIQITASHNPGEYNGIKLFDSTGRVISGQMGAAVLRRYREKTEAGESYDRARGCYAAEPEASHFLPRFIDRVLETVDVPTIQNRQFKVLLDSNNGSGSTAEPLLQQLGCQYTILGGQRNGAFLHTPEPTEENLQGVCQEMVRQGADIGFCQDPDADRLAIIDASGRYIGEEYTVALCIRRALFTRKGNVVINCASSQMSEDIARAAGFECARSSVGEANVVDKMKAIGAVYGGEGNGGPIDPNVGYVRDSFVGIAQILDLMARTEKTIAELADEIQPYSIVKTKIPFPTEKLPELYRAVIDCFPEDAICREDGLRLSNANRWLLVRPSNTEPIVRAIAEASEKQKALDLCNLVAKIAEKIA